MIRAKTLALVVAFAVLPAAFGQQHPKTDADTVEELKQFDNRVLRAGKVARCCSAGAILCSHLHADVSQRRETRQDHPRCSGRHRLAGSLFHDLLGDVRRDLLVGLELHRVGGASLRVRAQVGRVAEHLTERHARRDGERVAAALLPFHAKEHPQRIDYEYERAGTASIFMFAEPSAGRRQNCSRDKDQD